MRDRIDELGPQTEVVLVTFTDSDSLDAYQTDTDLGFAVVTDPQRWAYRAFGLGRGRLARIWGWRSARRYLEILRAEGLAGIRRPIEDTRQLGGDFVVDGLGRLVWGHWSEGPDDRPTVDDLITAVAAAR